MVKMFLFWSVWCMNSLLLLLLRALTLASGDGSNNKTSTLWQTLHGCLVFVPSCSSEDNNYVLMVIYGGCLEFWRPGEKAWITIETPKVRINGIAYHKGQFYAVGRKKIFVCDVGGRDPTTAQVVAKIPTELVASKESHIVVESNGEVLIVVRDRYLGIPNKTRSFAAFKLDLSNGGLKELESLGDNALFLGNNASISVKASKHKGIRPNCIYYNYHWGSLMDIGIYDMDQSEDMPCYDLKSFSSIFSALWVTPYF